MLNKSIRVGVRLGEYDITKEIDCLGNTCADPVLHMGIAEKIPHEGYNEKSKNRGNDIGLIRLDGEVTYTDYIRPICLPTLANSPRAFPNERLVSAGWGRTLTSKIAIILYILCIVCACAIFMRFIFFLLTLHLFTLT